MAIVEQPATVVVARSGDDAVQESSPLGIFARPVAAIGWRSWLFTVDHKRIGLMYGVAALGFFIVGGVEALAIRAQLFQPDGKVRPRTSTTSC